MSKSKETTEKTDSETILNQSQQMEQLEALVQPLQTQLVDLISFLASQTENPNWLTDLANQSTQIPKDSLKVTYSLKIEDEYGDLVDFNNTTVIHQAAGINPVNTVNRVSTLLTTELLEPAVLMMQNYVTKNVEKIMHSQEENDEPMSW